MPYQTTLPVPQLTRIQSVLRDLTAGSVVFLVALPLCLGVALASDAPLISGLIAGIVGGIVVGALSGSHTSVSGPAAGLTAVVASQIATLPSYEAFLLAVALAGLFQIALGLLRAGFLAAFVPSSVIKGLLAAIGVILVLKQIPHLLGHDADPEGEMSFLQPDHENTFSEYVRLLGDLHWGAACIGIVSLAILLAWESSSALRRLRVPAPLAVVALGVALAKLLALFGDEFRVGESHLVQVPVAQDWRSLADFLRFPDVRQCLNPAIYAAGGLIAIVGSLETLLNLEAVDRIDPHQRVSPPNRELVAQGVGNLVTASLGGIPITSVIVRSSVNILAGARTKLSTISHGALLFLCVVFLPSLLNQIPLSCLAAVLLATGFKLASPKLARQMWSEGPYQFLPFIGTVIAIVFTDLLVGVLLGLGMSLTFILIGNIRRPLRKVVERHAAGDVLRIELANQVSFLHRPSLERALHEVPNGGHILLDASQTNFVDPDVLSLVREYKERTGPARGVRVSLRGFRDHYQLDDEVLYVDYATRELQERLTAAEVLEILRQGNERFRSGRQLTRDLGRQVQATSQGQHPLAVILSCIDSRTPSELIFDLGLGDILSIRIAGNVTSPRVLGSIEYGCAVAGAKLVLVLGHTRCGAVTAAVDWKLTGAAPTTLHSQNLEPILADIGASIPAERVEALWRSSDSERLALVDSCAQANVLRSVRQILEHSDTIRHRAAAGQCAVVGACYDVSTGQIQFLTGLDSVPLVSAPLAPPNGATSGSQWE